MFVVGSPTWTGIVVDFDLDHLFDAVNNAWHADLLFRFGSWLCLWLLLHVFSLYALEAFAAARAASKTLG